MRITKPRAVFPSGALTRINLVPAARWCFFCATESAFLAGSSTSRATLDTGILSPERKKEKKKKTQANDITQKRGQRKSPVSMLSSTKHVPDTKIQSQGRVVIFDVNLKISPGTRSREVFVYPFGGQARKTNIFRIELPTKKKKESSKRELTLAVSQDLDIAGELGHLAKSCEILKR